MELSQAESAFNGTSRNLWPGNTDAPSTNKNTKNEENRNLLLVVDTVEKSGCLCAGVRLHTTLFAVIVACIMSVMVGTSFAYSSATLLELEEIGDPDFRFDTSLSDIFGDAVFVGSIFGGPAAGFVADKCGRKTSLAINVLPYLVGYFAILISYLIREAVIFKVLLILGRFISGIGFGWTTTIVPIYIGEISPANLRGSFIVIADISMSIGFLISYGLGSVPNFHYYQVALVFIAILAFYMMLFLCIPESPRWLLLQGKDRQRAKAVLTYLRGSNQTLITKELDGIISSISKMKLSLCQILAKIFCEKSTLVPFLIALFSGIFQQLCGIGIVTAYMAEIFEDAGASNPNLMTVLIGALAILFGRIPAISLVDVIGRKILFLISAAGMGIGCMLVGVQFYLARPSLCTNPSSGITDVMTQCHSNLFPLVAVGIFLFTVSFGIGNGSIPNIMLSEYLPLSVRGIGSGIIVCASRITGVIVVGSFFTYSKLAGTWTLWWTFSFFNLVGFIVILLFVVETKGKTLEEVQELFKKRNIFCHFC